MTSTTITNSPVSTLQSEMPALENYLQSHPADVNHLIMRGDAFLAFGRYEEALNDLNLAIQLDPMNAKAYASRAVVFIRTDNFEKAFGDLRTQIALDRKDPMGYCNRGALYVVIKRYDSAMADLCEAIRLDRTCAPAYANLGEIYYMNDRYTDAIEVLNVALDLFPSSGESHYFRGKSFEAIGDITAAQADIERAAELGYTPGSIESYYRSN